ncbi:MAG: hypothetical protein ACTSSA_09200 [Candidatus Freyarchaeota archaeon]
MKPDAFLSVYAEFSFEPLVAELDVKEFIVGSYLDFFIQVLIVKQVTHEFHSHEISDTMRSVDSVSPKGEKT